MGENSLRQAYKAVCTSVDLSGKKATKEAPIKLVLLDLNEDSYARVFWTINGHTVGISKVYGEAPQQIGYASDTENNNHLVYGNDIVILELTNIPKEVTSIDIKTEIVYGSVKSFPKISTEEVTGTNFYLTTSDNSVKITNPDKPTDTKQIMNLPGGFTEIDAGKFASINVSETANIEGTLRIKGDFGEEEKTKDSIDGSRITLRQFIHKTIEKDYLYDGVYTQNP